VRCSIQSTVRLFVPEWPDIRLYHANFQMVFYSDEEP